MIIFLRSSCVIFCFRDCVIFCVRRGCLIFFVKRLLDFLLLCDFCVKRLKKNCENSLFYENKSCEIFFLSENKNLVKKNLGIFFWDIL